MTSTHDEHLHLKALNRRCLLDELLALGDIAGRKDFIEFLQLTWELDKMPSTDPRFSTASGDIWQHMVNNCDWDDDYLYGSYLGLIDAADEQFLRFIENAVHPLVRKSGEQEQYIEIANKYLPSEGFQLQVADEISGHKVYRTVKISAGVNETVKNLIFAAIGPKPRIVLADAVSNTIQLIENEQFSLVYDLAIPQNGLLWSDLIAWWAARNQQTPDIDTERALFRRLRESLSPQSPPERYFFEAYFKIFRDEYGSKLPALIPQVYLHYDPYTFKELHGRAGLARQRMDFLLLLPHRERIVIEIDGQQHYADELGKADPRRYAEMVIADRELKLAGYDIYRFGGSELQENTAAKAVESFFRNLFRKHQVIREQAH